MWGVAVALAAVTPPAEVGVASATSYVDTLYAPASDTTVPESVRTAAPRYDPAKRIVAILIGNHGANSGDVLPLTRRSPRLGRSTCTPSPRIAGGSRCWAASTAAAFDLPIRLNARVTALRHTDDRFEIRTRNEVLRAGQVVVATGRFQTPHVPSRTGTFDLAVTQLHSAGYHNPEPLPAGRTLVVGGGNSGLQIADELAATRQVVVSAGERPAVLPQRLLGHDLFWWLTRLGVIRVSSTTPPRVPAAGARRVRRRIEPAPSFPCRRRVPATAGRCERAYGPLH